MMTKSNFEFLKGVNDFTYAIACAAENNYPDDPNTALVKMRMFGEATAKHLGLLLDIPLCENQHDLLRELGKISFVDDNILSVFHKLRRIGNQAVHEYHNDLDDAQMPAPGFPSCRLVLPVGNQRLRLSCAGFCAA